MLGSFTCLYVKGRVQVGEANYLKQAEEMEGWALQAREEAYDSAFQRRSHLSAHHRPSRSQVLEAIPQESEAHAILDATAGGSKSNGTAYSLLGAPRPHSFPRRWSCLK